ncbi:PadR family transcriptional regulator [Paenibacillus sp. CAA11]|uniref:PadR family transcriptional regulator n=1 Tax=Paenibacillus sp. CAA11 TaxID=1532905 RepID=UPI00131F2AA3|nr:PadR family transcriptional regulator [Paenibacillus sp. CAA11]
MSDQHQNRMVKSNTVEKGERRTRFYGRGGVKYAILEQLEQGSKYGYQIIKALGDNSGGIYIPSAGSIYPTLRTLEQRNLIQSEMLDGKKVYTIQEAGRQFLKSKPIQEEYGAAAYRAEKYRLEREGHGKAFKEELAGLMLLVSKTEKATVGHPSHWARFQTAIAQFKEDVNSILEELQPAIKSDK